MDKSYDAYGRLSAEYQPRYTLDPTQYIARSLTYDDLNRVTTVSTLAENGSLRTTTTNYQDLLTIVTSSAIGQQTPQVRNDTRDVLGRLRKVVNAIGGITKFDYEPFGAMSRAVDPNSNEVNVTYDNWGHRKSLIDPDLGTILYSVDPLGRTWKQISRKQALAGQFTTFEYDLLDRLTKRVETDLISVWMFDTAAHGFGKLAEAYTLAGAVKDYDRVLTYNDAGRSASTSQTLYGNTYAYSQTYDAWGRLITQSYTRGADAPKVFDSRYNKFGYLTTIERAGFVLWTSTGQDATQRLLNVSLGNGLSQSRVFDPNTARLKDAFLKAGTDIRLQENYLYDELGNVANRMQYWDTSGYQETFHYDGLNRLHDSTVLGQTQQTFLFDAVGNWISKTGAGNYTYPPQNGLGTIRPHAVKAISGVLNTSFIYDDNGNLTSGAGRTEDWTSFDMPLQITKGSQSVGFRYGPEHQRTRQTRGSTIVDYAGAQEVEMTGSNVTVKTYWPNGIGVEIDRPGVGASEVSWMHTDRLGSVIALTKIDGSIREKLAYDAWGKRRTVDGVPVTEASTGRSTSTPDERDGATDNRGFTGHEMLDQVDLVHMNGRVYDPMVGAFLSADRTVSDPANGQNYNRFSYVLNNPTNFTDPTGYWALLGGFLVHLDFMAIGAIAPPLPPVAPGDPAYSVAVQGTKFGPGVAQMTASGRAIFAGMKALEKFADSLADSIKNRVNSGEFARQVKSGFIGAVKIGVLPGVGLLKSKAELSAIFSESAEPPSSDSVDAAPLGANTASGAPDPDDEQKPRRVSNSKHHPNSVSPEPKNVDQLYEESIVDKKGVRWAKDAEGNLHRFSKPSNGEVHWNGSTSGVDPIKPQNIPNEIRKFFQFKG
ncbi:MAG: RHS repeat-associated core domain-containing protein [Pseudomonadota bacterium]